MSKPTMLEIRARYARAIHAEHDRTWQSGAEEFDCWLDGIKADAWDEGLGAGCDRWADSREFGDPPVNPYREVDA